jgi:hypothetical protein
LAVDDERVRKGEKGGREERKTSLEDLDVGVTGGDCESFDECTTVEGE